MPLPLRHRREEAPELRNLEAAQRELSLDHNSETAEFLSRSSPAQDLRVPAYNLLSQWAAICVGPPRYPAGDVPRSIQVDNLCPQSKGGTRSPA